jgi:hypothetical protein
MRFLIAKSETAKSDDNSGGSMNFRDFVAAQKAEVTGEDCYDSAAMACIDMALEVTERDAKRRYVSFFLFSEEPYVIYLTFMTVLLLPPALLCLQARRIDKVYQHVI